ncbi:MAG: VIT family protein [Candidatus Microsaccharimonas sp.]
MNSQKSSESDSQHIATSNNSLNKLRAAVLGANDGIVSTAGIILGVAGAAASKETILIAGTAGLVAGAISMAAGEFVSVSSQRDSEKSFLANIRKRHTRKDTKHQDELITIYIEKGFSEKTARTAVAELQKKKLLERELEKENGIDPDDISSPWAAAIASACSFTAGALIPLLAVAFAPDTVRLPITIVAVLLSLVLTGTLSARAGQANQLRAALRIVIWGVGAMVVTYAIGHVIGVGIS